MMKLVRPDPVTWLEVLVDSPLSGLVITPGQPCLQSASTVSILKTQLLWDAWFLTVVSPLLLKSRGGRDSDRPYIGEDF
jgi:hypothetical protein